MRFESEDTRGVLGNLGRLKVLRNDSVDGEEMIQVRKGLACTFTESEGGMREVCAHRHAIQSWMSEVGL